MALSKTRFAALAVAVMTLLTAAAAAPAADAAAAAADAATVEYESLRIEGLSDVADAPALTGLADRSPYGGGYGCRAYFKCQQKTEKVVAKHTYACYFKIASSAAARSAGGLCRPNPYGCVAAKCGGWVKCKCDKCQTVSITYPVWCEQ